MTIKRQYSLPNCNLILEGLSTEGDASAAPLSVLLNVECYLAGAAVPLTGGREFLDSLVMAVSNYAQRLLSGIAPSQPLEEHPLVELKPGDGPYHHLLVRNDKPLSEEAGASDRAAVPLIDLKLSTVQFFDLMEAVDQLLADPQTLPDLTLALSPLSRRLVKPAEPVAKRVAPAVIGASTLAAAALALFFVPPPEFKPAESSESADPAAVESTPASSTQPTPPVRPEPADSEAAGSGQNTDAATAAAAIDRLATAPAISDEATLETLRQQVDNELTAAWQIDAVPTEDWAYRLTVSERGEILGYKYENDAALANADSTPLPQVTYTPVDPTQPESGPVAQFVARFTPAGEVVVEPLAVEPDTANDGAAALTAIERRIEGRSQIETLNADLRRQLIEARQTDRFDQAIAYRVRLNETGAVVGYEAVDAAAADALSQTPLPQLLDPAAADGALADFKVVFTERGVVEVNPWDGWPK